MSISEIERQQPNRFLVPIQEYESQSSRIKGFQELFTNRLRAPEPLLVLGHQGFLHYQAFAGLTQALEEEISVAYRNIRSSNPKRGAYIGRAFYVPGIDNPNGPRTAAIRDEKQYIQEVTKFWDFVIENGYNVEDSDIALILHPFIHVMDPPRTHYGNIPLKENERLPFGAGYLVPNPQPGRPNLIKILGINGSDEAVVSCPHDVYEIDPDTDTILTKDVALKDSTYVPGHGNEYGVLEIPATYQTLQALTDKEILTIAHEVEGVLKSKPVRIEFAIQSDGVYYREIAPWHPSSPRELLKLQPGESISGSIIRVETPFDIHRVKDTDSIIYFPPEAFRVRTTDLFARVALLPEVQRMVALVHGTIETSHMARILSDAGRSVVPVGDQEFFDGTTLRISREENGSARIEYLNPYENAIIPFSDVANLSKGEAGQKVARLAFMRHFGIPVPDGFALRSNSIWQYLDDIGLRAQVLNLDTINIGNLEELEKTTNAIQKSILENPLPSGLEEQIRSAIKQQNYPLYAIRSSGSEDGEKQSRAGLYQSAVAVRSEKISCMIRQTVASYFSSASIISLHRSGQFPSHMKIGVGIHEYIPETPQTIGAVVFSNPKSILIEAAPGSPEGIVSGTAKNYLKVTIPRESKDISIKALGNSNICIPKETIMKVVAITRQIEELFKSYQDIELLITPDRGIVVVQARPL